VCTQCVLVCWSIKDRSSFSVSYKTVHRRFTTIYSFMIDMLLSFLLKLRVLQRSIGVSLLTTTVETHSSMTLSCGTEEAQLHKFIWS
jgi:hypothetical protein